MDVAMWSIREEPAGADRARRHVVEAAGRPAGFGEVLRAWREDAAFRLAFNEALAGAPFGAFRWETPPVTAGTLGRPFEFVLIEAAGLDRDGDPSAFADHFGPEVATFPNLGGDAVLVVPSPRAGPSAYGHLAAFARRAPESQRDALWRAVGLAMEHRVGERPVWLSTAGAGVPWLHVRLDDRPKYYGHAPYRTGP